jgi:hypothetical protein
MIEKPRHKATSPEGEVALWGRKTNFKTPVFTDQGGLVFSV